MLQALDKFQEYNRAVQSVQSSSFNFSLVGQTLPQPDDEFFFMLRKGLFVEKFYPGLAFSNLRPDNF